jgi:SAM-dependent methyltransferase
MIALACPSCDAELRDEGDAVRCPCGPWPVVAGIPVLLPWALGRRPSLGDVLARFRPPARGLLARLSRRLFSGAAELELAAADPDAAFLELAGALRQSADLDYFRYRHSAPAFVAAAALLRALDRGPVVDVGCGAGHLLRALSRRLPDAALAGVDATFPLLYLAKRFLCPRAFLVCADVSRRLPFRDGAFEAGVSLDAFNYLPDGEVAARELQRVVRGPILIPHLLDPAYRSPHLRPPLPPDAYRALFAGREPRLYREEDLFKAFVDRRILDLSAPSEQPTGTLTLVAGVAPRVYEGADFFAVGKALNPIYEAAPEGEKVRLRRRPGPHGAWLPEELVVDRAALESGDPALAARFILLDLPERYAR